MARPLGRSLMIVALTFLIGCAGRFPENQPPKTGTYRVPTSIRFNLSNRDFLLHVPPETEPDKPLPLVVVLHGAFNTARQTEKETGFSARADEEKFIVVYPEGIGIFGFLQHWNAGHCCGKAAQDNIDDLTFIDAVIAKTNSLLPIDPDRIYMAGMSNGGMLTYRYAAERGHKLAAIAAVATPIGSRENMKTPNWTIPDAVLPLPVIAFHGTGDKHVPIEGGVSPLKKGPRSYDSYENAMNFWKSMAACQNTPVISEADRGSVVKTDYRGCAEEIQLTFYTLKDWEHHWPAPYFTTRLKPGDPLYNFDATRLIWEFFRKHKRPNTGGVSK